MTKPTKHVPKHRAAPKRPAVVESPRKAVRTTLVLSSVAVATTGVAVSGGVMSAHPASILGAAAADPADDGDVPNVERPDPASYGGYTLESLQTDVTADRGPTISRSADRRAGSDPVKVAVLDADNGPAVTGSQDLAESDPRDIAKALLGEFGFGADQFSCLDSLYTRESNWQWNADNPTSSAYGIPQALPGSKMSSAGADWETNPVTQIRWGLGYIRDRYGSPCGAWGQSQAVGWY